MELIITQGDITEADVDAIVNAANTALVLGAGVAGAIRRKGGPEVQQECDALGPIGVGEVAITGSGQLRQKYILHAATMMPTNPHTSAKVVASCTRHALEKAEHLGCESIAFPALGCGIAGLHPEACAEAMLEVVRDFEPKADSVKKVVFVLYDKITKTLFEEEAATPAPEG